MFADIYPLTRLPRRFGAFTYAVPHTMSPSEATRGALVIIPWRSGSVRGIVSNTHTRQPKTETKTVLEMLPQCLSDLELNVYERVAEETFQSVSSVLHAAFPAPRKRASLNTPPLSPSSRNSSQTTLTTSPHIPVSELERLEHIAMNPPLRTFVETGDLIETALLVRFLAKHRPGSILFLVPHEHDLHVAAELLSMWGSRPSLCTSALTQPKRHDLSLAWRNGEIPLLLSTRIGSLFLPPQNLSAIVIGRSGVDEHAQYDRNPRYDARRFAESWSKVRDCPLLICDTLARCADHINPIPREETYPCKIVNLADRVQFGDDPLLTDPLKAEINKTLESRARVLLICNQKGLGARLECKDCAFVELCGSCTKPLAVYETHLFCAACKRATKRPQNCRKCRSEKQKTVRRGTGSLRKLMKTHWPNASIAVVEKEHIENHAKAEIVIATSFYYENVYRPHADAFGLVALPCADQEIHLESDCSRGARRLIECQGIAKRNRCPFLLQTWDPKLFHRLLHDTNAILEEECRARQEFGQAPFAQELELFGRGTGGLRELDRVLTLARAASETTVTELTPARWKILTKSAKLLEELQQADDTLVIANRTYL